MNKPTQEQAKEFWERCGLHLVGATIEVQAYWVDAKWFSITMNEKLPIDLNNLFEYAVDWNEIATIQFSYGDDGHHCWIYMKKPVGKPFHGYGDTDEDALFWALRLVDNTFNQNHD